MECHSGEAFFIGMVFIGLLWVGSTLLFDPWNKGYERGKIDALTGKVCYFLEEYPDQTRHWEKIEPCAEHQEN